MAHMKRRRMIHPGLHANKKLCRVSIFARWLFTAIFTNADDEGFAGGDPMEWKLAAFPLDSLVAEEDRDVTADDLLKMMVSDGFVEELPDGQYRLMGLSHMIDTLTSRVRDGYVPLLERRETLSGEPILYLPGWDEAQTIRGDIKKDSTIRASLRDKELHFDVTGTSQGRNTPVTQASKEASKKKDLKDSQKRESEPNGSNTTDVVSIAEKLRNESLRLTAMSLKYHFGNPFDPYTSAFCGWAFVQKIVTAAKRENRNAAIFVGEIKNGSSGKIKDSKAYLNSVMQAGLYPEPLEGADKPKFYTYNEWQDQIVQQIENGKGP